MIENEDGEEAAAAAEADAGGVENDVPALLQGEAAADIKNLPFVHTLVAAIAALRTVAGDKLDHLLPPALQPKAAAEQLGPAEADGEEAQLEGAEPGGAEPDAAADAVTVEDLDMAALHVQCAAGQVPSQKQMLQVLARLLGDKVEAEMKRALVGDGRVQELARFRSQRHKHSIGLAFINEPMGGGSAEFDGMPWQLALKRAVGVERTTDRCHLPRCDKQPGGTLHARLCQASAAKGHDTRFTTESS